ncbi:MAG: hypothetical protein FJ023_09300 [Chloroflexi bacterium]|nr:hypothetical protein [Chloroflexota bacterium]
MASELSAMEKLLSAIIQLLKSIFGKDEAHGGGGGRTVMYQADVMRDFSRLGIRNFGYEDDWYHFPADPEVWAEWCYKARSACPPYKSNTETHMGFDCDDFAKCFAAYCRQKGLSNAIWEVWGKTPAGRHAWNVFQCAENKYEIEPQTGEIWPLGTKSGWKAEIRL